VQLGVQQPRQTPVELVGRPTGKYAGGRIVVTFAAPASTVLQ